MRKALTATLLLAIVACSQFQSQRVRQYNYAIEEAAKQTTIFLEAGKIDADQAEAIHAALKVASAQVDRYWAAVRDGAPRKVTDAIFSAIQDALNEASRILAQKEKA